MANLNIKFNNKQYSIDSSLLADATARLEAHLITMKDQPIQTLAPGLYETGAINLWQEGNYDAASAMMTTSWEELEENGVLAVSKGVDIELPEMNEYGFYYGVLYSFTVDGMTISFTFNEDGSAVFNQAGEIMELPAGTAVYEERLIDMTALGLPIFEVSTDGTCLEADGIVMTIGSGTPPKGTLYLNSVNDEPTKFEGDLVLLNDGSITRLNSGIFMKQSLLTDILIPDSISSIPTYAFEGCSGLTSINIPKTITHIGDYAFSGCNNFISIIIPYNVTDIGYRAFYECIKLASVTIESSNLSIKDEAFNCCQRLTEVINKSDLSIVVGSYDFGRIALYATEVHNGPSKLIRQNDCLFYSYNGINYLVSYLRDDFKPVLPSSYNGKEYALRKNVFLNNSNLSSIIIPSAVTSIGDEAFGGCTGLISVTIDNGVTNIGNYAFSSCSNLPSITIPDSVTNIGEYAFYNCKSLNRIDIPDSVTTIGKDAFRDCEGLTTVRLSNSITSIAEATFYNCTVLTSIAIPDNVTSIGSSAFYDCSNLASVTISDSVTIINQNAFEYCSSLTMVEFGKNSKLTSIGLSAFGGCSALTSIEIPASVTNIGYGAFESCSALTSIEIPASVTNIGKKAFNWCSQLNSITFDGTIVQWNSVTKGEYWNYDVPATHVHCIDGDVAL
jgi:hypothetical protein